MADLLKRASSLSALNLPNLGHRRVSSNSLYEDDAGDGTPHIEIARRTMGGRVLITLVRCLLVYTLFEDGVRILRRPAAQASVLDVPHVRSSPSRPCWAAWHEGVWYGIQVLSPRLEATT